MFLCGAANPNIDKAVSLLITYETSARDKYENAKRSSARSSQRNPEVAIKETNFFQLMSLQRQSFITFQVYLSQILDLYSFIPKNKYVEDLIDTGASDDTDVSDESSEEEGDEYDDDPYEPEPDIIETVEATDTEAVFRVETNGLLATGTINCEVWGQARGKRGYKIHLPACRKKALKEIV
jgi:hypothetical protein